MKFFSRFNKTFKKIKKGHYSPSPKTRRIIWGILFFVIVTMILTINLIPNRIDLKSGQVSKVDITAPRTVTFIDQKKTEQLKQSAAEAAPKVYEEDSNVNIKIEEEIKSIFNKIKIKQQEYFKTKSGQEEQNINPTTISDNNAKILVRQIDGISAGIEESSLQKLIQTEVSKLNQLESTIQEIMDKQLQKRILPGDIPSVRVGLRQEVMDLDYDRSYRLIAADILLNLIEANMFLNEEATAARREETIAQVEPAKRTVRQGEIIIRKGDVVQPEDIRALEELGLQKPQVNYLNFIGILLIVLIIILLLAIYIYMYRPDIWEDNQRLLLIELLIVVVIALAKIISIFQSPYANYLVPAAVASILITVLLDRNLAVVTTIFLSLLLAPLFNFDLHVVMLSFLGGLVGIYSVSKVTERGDLVRAGFYVSLVHAFIITGLIIVGPIRDWVFLLWAVGSGILNGVLVAILANGLLPYLESLFDLTSSVKLLELSNASQPLLKRLLVEAPGSYHHSVIVGNLAETAADDIGADSLLARVGAYYHDIGKMKRPYFFTDNQFGGENPHDKTSPNLSSLIIKSHVKDGVELARENKLPQIIIDIIKQHHGTNLISYFYQQALQENKHRDVEKSDFRYDGPKPQTREAAIIMLADIVEAAVRSKKFDKHNHNRIEGLVRGLIRDKLIENQLDESDLTLKDLEIIGSSFVKVLTGIYHQRVEYPENLLKEMQRNDKSD